MATIGTAFLSEMHVGGRSRSDLIGRGLDPAPPRIPPSFAQLVPQSAHRATAAPMLRAYVDRGLGAVPARYR